MSESMVERVCRALAKHDNPKHENWWPSYESRARVAIEAMREPTEAMEVAGGLKCEALMFEGDGSGIIFKDMGHVYRSMLAAALEEGKQ